jgi:excisionase family DNA binding protein
VLKAKPNQEPTEAETGLRAELQFILDSVQQIPRERLPALLGELEVIRATAVMRLSAPTAMPDRHDELLGVEQAAERLGIGKDYLYRNAKKLSFTRRIGRKLVFSSAGIDEYIRKTRPK